MKFGAHLSIVGGYDKALERARSIGANCLQIFSSPPRGWKFPYVSDEQINLFKQTKKQLVIEPVYFHASYLINLADQKLIGQNSVKFLIKELNLADKLGIKGSIVHLGSFKGEKTQEKYNQLLKNIEEILKNTQQKTLFIIENAGNRKIGQSLDEVASIVKDLNNKRVRICLDSCHLWSAGFGLSDSEKLNKFLSDFDKKIGLNKLEVWHLNDSRDPFESFRDRHENIGQGTIGLNEFKIILNNEKINHLPFIIETPGFDNQGPDKKNLDILKTLVN
jgi:deoxyribonuclease-4